MKEITYEELEKIVQKQPTAFLCGNGFSINFDSDFVNIYDRLYETHKLLIRNGKFEVKANNSFQKIFKDNYKSVCKYVYTYRQKDMEQVFASGVYFAESIVENGELLEELNNMRNTVDLCVRLTVISFINFLLCTMGGREAEILCAGYLFASHPPYSFVFIWG